MEATMVYLDIMSHDDEREQVARAQNDPQAFGQLYQQYVKRIYNYLYRQTRSHEDAEDLTSRTFFQALRSIGAYRDWGIPFQTWLFRIAHNLVVNWYRDQNRRQVVCLESVEEGLSVDALDPHESVVAQEEQERLLKMINELPEDRKTLLILKFSEKMSNADIALVLGRTEGAVKVLYHRTLASLREKFEQLSESIIGRS